MTSLWAVGDTKPIDLVPRIAREDFHPPKVEEFDLASRGWYNGTTNTEQRATIDCGRRYGPVHCAGPLPKLRMAGFALTSGAWSGV